MNEISISRHFVAHDVNHSQNVSDVFDIFSNFR